MLMSVSFEIDYASGPGMKCLPVLLFVQVQPLVSGGGK